MWDPDTTLGRREALSWPLPSQIVLLAGVRGIYLPSVHEGQTTSCVRDSDIPSEGKHRETHPDKWYNQVLGLKTNKRPEPIQDK